MYIDTCWINRLQEGSVVRLCGLQQVHDPRDMFIIPKCWKYGIITVTSVTKSDKCCLCSEVYVENLGWLQITPQTILHSLLAHANRTPFFHLST